MIKKLIKLTLVLFSLLMVTSCFNQQNNVEVYSFSGENDNLVINNGVIIVTDKLEKFVGGELTFKDEVLSDVQQNETKFYFYKDGIETVILSNIETIVGSEKGSSIQPNMGSSSSEHLFNGDDLDLILKSLNFTLKGNFMDGKTFEYHLVLDIKKVY